MTMHNRLDDAKAELLARAAAVVDRPDGGAPLELEPFLRHYYRHVPPEDLVDRDPVDVVGAALSHRQLAQRRPQGTANVRVFTPNLEEHGWSSGHTVVEIVTDDMPFLVDSVTITHCPPRSIQLVVHPQLVVRRDVTGELLEVGEVADSERAAADRPECIVESWMHIEIDRETNAEDVRATEERLRAVLRDVQKTVEDWQKMQGRARSVADIARGRGAARPRVKSAIEAVELLRWLADDHFTYLAVQYGLDTVGGEDVLRCDRHRPRHTAHRPRAVGLVRQAPRCVRRREKTPSRADQGQLTRHVHRPAFLDYVGVKVFDEYGEVVGERRFLGVHRGRLHRERDARSGAARSKARAVLDVRLAPSHSGKDLLAILETYPRDELFHIPVDELSRTAEAVLHLQERRQLRLFRPAGPLWALPVLPRLLAARPLRHRGAAADPGHPALDDSHDPRLHGPRG